MLANYVEKQDQRILVCFSYVRLASGTELDYLKSRLRKSLDADKNTFSKGFEECLEISRSFYLFDNGRFQCDLEDSFPCSINNVEYFRKKMKRDSLLRNEDAMQRFLECLLVSASKKYSLDRNLEEIEFCLTETQDYY